jgi:hypothetical protein
MQELEATHVSDFGARMDGDDITMLHTQIVPYDTVDASTAIIQVVIVQDNENSVFSLLAFDENCITTEELESVHSLVRKRDDGVVVIYSVSDTMESALDVGLIEGHVNWNA